MRSRQGGGRRGEEGGQGPQGGRKKGVEIEGAADMSGLTCFCTRMQEAGDNLALLEVSMEGMNAIPDPSNEEEAQGLLGTHLQAHHRIERPNE